MKNPKYTEQLYAIICFSLGCTFVGCGLLSFFGILKPSPHSMVQNDRILGIVFLTVGVVFCIAKLILTNLASKKEQLNEELFSNGTKVTGTVEKVYLQKQMQYGKKSPYRILYTYSYQGEIYHGKSGLLWEEPHVKAADSIEVFVNESGESAIR